MEIYLIRHTAPAIEKGICYGFSDIDLLPDWSTDAALVRAQLPIDTDLTVYSSPLRRCRQLAEYLAGQGQVLVDDRLRELHFGDWELRRWDDLPQADLNRWMNDYVHTPCPGGESYLDLFVRARSFLEDLTAQPHQTVGIVSHGGWIRAALAAVRGVSLEAMMAESVGYGAVLRL
jgi:alpha-ribazole phosphatase